MFLRSTRMISASGLALIACSASASPMFVATVGQDLYRFDLNGNVEVFDLGREFNAAATDSQGRIWLSEKHDIDGDGFRSLERIDNAASSIALVHQGDFLQGPSATMAFVDGTLHALQNIGQPMRQLVTIDPLTQTTQAVGQTGLINSRAQSMAYDPESGTLYGSQRVSTMNDALLIQHSVSPIEDPTQSVFGSLGVIQRSSGGEWLDDTYYHAAVFEDVQGAFSLRIGTIDTQTGAWSSIATIASDIENGAVALAAVPAPASAGALGLAGLMATRRRR